MDTFLPQLVNGLTLGGMYALIALGYTMVYGVLLLINFAHSEMIMSGGYVGLGAFLLLTNEGAIGPAARWFTSGSALSIVVLLLVVVLAAGLVTGLVGVLTERVAYRPLRHAPRLAPLISAVGVSIFLQNAALLWIFPSHSFPEILPHKDLGYGLTLQRVVIIGSSVVLLVVLDLFVNKTKVGRAMRATSQDKDAAGLMGVSVNRVIAVTFFIGPALGAVAGVFSGMYYGSITYNMGFFPGIKAFTAAVLGGIGDIRGAMVGGFFLGLVESMVAAYVSAGYKDVVTFLILIVVLVFRPGGIFGDAQIEKV
ncbi:MAG: branched-chain amino acid ABC transporter permease [Propionibacteriaceae bacterium]|jgi:branched-chain amino acid transport system permease protein|nr:branched-chain amino acid ABC transporter permease [Propionibacteriaceae bacterium]